METVAEKLNLSPDDLAALLESYGRAAERLKDSHDSLQLEVRRLREELAAKNRQLERRKRLAALGEMAAGLAHEIRNPLGGIQLYAGLLRRDLSDRPGLADLVDKMITGVKILDALVTDVLALTHTVQPRFAATDLVPLVQSAIELLSPQVQERQSRVVCQAPSAVPMVGDPNMLQRATLNLLRNAIEAAGNGGQVLVELTPKKKEILLHVADTGPGVDPKVTDQIFNPFFTTKDAGTGLGLAIVHRIIEAHEGSIRVSRAAIGGALFTIRIPREPSAARTQRSKDDE